MNLKIAAIFFTSFFVTSSYTGEVSRQLIVNITSSLNNTKAIGAPIVACPEADITARAAVYVCTEIKDIPLQTKCLKLIEGKTYSDMSSLGYCSLMSMDEAKISCLNFISRGKSYFNSEKIFKKEAIDVCLLLEARDDQTRQKCLETIANKYYKDMAILNYCAGLKNNTERALECLNFVFEKNFNSFAEHVCSKIAEKDGLSRFHCLKVIADKEFNLNLSSYCRFASSPEGKTECLKNGAGKKFSQAALITCSAINENDTANRVKCANVVANKKFGETSKCIDSDPEKVISCLSKLGR